MQPLGQSSSSTQNTQHDYKSLERMLRDSIFCNNDGRPLRNALNSDTIPRDVLRTLLFQAYVWGGECGVRTVTATKSYTTKVVANIIVDAFEVGQGEYALKLFKDDGFRLWILHPTLHAAVGRGTDLKDDEIIKVLIEELHAYIFIKDETTKQNALEIANACDKPNAKVIEYLKTKL